MGSNVKSPKDAPWSRYFDSYFEEIKNDTLSGYQPLEVICFTFLPSLKNN